MSNSWFLQEAASSKGMTTSRMALVRIDIESEARGSSTTRGEVDQTADRRGRDGTRIESVMNCDECLDFHCSFGSAMWQCLDRLIQLSQPFLVQI